MKHLKHILSFLYPLFLYLWVNVFLTFIVGIGISVAAAANGTAPSADEVAKEVMRFFGAINIAQFIILLPFFYWIIKRDDRGMDFGNIKLNLSPVGIGVVASLAISICAISNVLIGLSGIAEYDPVFQKASETIFSGGLFLQILIVGIWVPVMEELLFRIIIYRRVRDLYGILAGSLVSAFLFALAHGNITQGIYAFIMGIVIAYLYEKMNTGLICILFHIIANITSILISEYGMLLENGIVAMVFMIVNVALLIYGIYGIKRYRLVKEDNGILAEE